MAHMLALRALSALLSYPGAELRVALPEIVAALDHALGLKPSHRQGLRALVDELAALDPFDAEARYVELFDRGRATSLHLFEHAYGDSRERGQAMVELKAIYARAGLNLTANELPDHLPVVLEYLSCRSQTEARAMLADCGDVLRAIGHALQRRESSYATVIEALLGIAGEAGLGAPPEKDALDAQPDLDRDWEERPAFEETASVVADTAFIRIRHPRRLP
jgi:nitrate reductase delta subunit